MRFSVEELFGFVQAFVIAAQKPLGSRDGENEFAEGVAIRRVVAEPGGSQCFPFAWVFVGQQQLRRGAAVRAGILAGDGFALFGFGTSGVLPGLVVGALDVFLRRIWFAGHARMQFSWSRVWWEGKAADGRTTGYVVEWGRETVFATAVIGFRMEAAGNSKRQITKRSRELEMKRRLGDF